MRTLIDLLSRDNRVRRTALEQVRFDLERSSVLFALRRVALEDEDATIRAKAVEILGSSRDPRALEWTREAALDRKPTVREAAVRALGRATHAIASLNRAPASIRDPSSLERPGASSELMLLRSAIARDPAWRVRRAAVLSLARILGAEAITELRASLDDPFWRVRHAAVRALSQIADREPGLRDAISAPDPALTPRAASALAYLRAHLVGEADGEARALAAASRPHDRALDPDPAVAAADLERPDFEVSPALLVECLADPHEPLRRAALERLREVSSPLVHRAALLWLEEERIPHAAVTARELLDSLGDRAVELAREVAKAGDAERPGAAAWAIELMARSDLAEAARYAHRCASSPSAKLRAVAIDAIASKRPLDGDDFATLECALDDKDETVATRAAWGLFESNAARALAALVERTRCGREPAGVLRAAVEAALALDDLDALEACALSEDTRTRARAIFGLGRAKKLTHDRRRALGADDDPWIRIAAFDEKSALEALRSDPDPEVRREALAIIAERRRSTDPRPAIEAVLTSLDPVLRANGTALLDPRCEADFEALLRKTRDRELLVRSSAASVLEPMADLDARLDRVLAENRDEEIRIAAHTWRWRRFDDAARTAIETALEDPRELADVRAHLAAMRIAFLEIEAPRNEASEDRSSAVEPRANPNRRQLGRTDLRITPLAISGAHQLSPGALLKAYERGVDLFFWEPSYANLTRFIRARKGSIAVIAGSYHASPNAIEADVDRALRRLRKETIDVFLLFWARSLARVGDEAFATLASLKQKGKIRAAGFSTHDRDLAASAIEAHPFDAIMIRHSAAHTGAETQLFPLAQANGTAVITFSALCYGRLLQRSNAAPEISPPSAADCYRYSMSRPGVCVTISAPRHYAELIENLTALDDPWLLDPSIGPIRAHGRRIREENTRFNDLVRREPHDVGDPLRQVEDSVTMRAVPESCNS